ncbi:MAG: hypothetical protein RBR74_13575, partial [Ignavibacteriaceae bacterium]|nr:hypothetical protein [Ignavibacteriaceae bacterium]
MILETMRGDSGDILIYSENRFNLENNFRMVRRNIGINTPMRLHYNEVCTFINDTQPKTVVAYRLLTNLDNFDINYVKYGQQVLVKGAREVIYFDPIYCVKEMEDNGFLNDDPELRFRIQQVGLRSIGHSEGLPDFEESYCFDLEASEVQNQNDRGFAELICAFDDIDFDKVINLSTNEIFDSPKVEPPPKPEPAKTKFQALSSEDLGFQKRNQNIQKSQERKGLVTLAWSRQTTGLFEEDDSYDPGQANKRVLMENGHPDSQAQAGMPSGSTDQQNARFQVVGQARKKNQFQNTQFHGRGSGNSDQQKSKSL